MPLQGSYYRINCIFETLKKPVLQYSGKPEKAFSLGKIKQTLVTITDGKIRMGATLYEYNNQKLVSAQTLGIIIKRCNLSKLQATELIQNCRY